MMCTSLILLITCLSCVYASELSSYAVTSMSGFDQSYFITDAIGNVVEDPNIPVIPLTTIVFTLQIQSQHPFVVSTRSDSMEETYFVTELQHISGCVTGQNSQGIPVEGSWVTAAAGEPCILSYTPPASITNNPVYYRCLNHPAMTGKIAVASTSVTPTPTTTSTPTTATPSTTELYSASAVDVPTMVVAILTFVSILVQFV